MVQGSVVMNYSNSSNNSWQHCPVPPLPVGAGVSVRGTGSTLHGAIDDHRSGAETRKNIS